MSPRNPAVGVSQPHRSCAIVANERLWRDLIKLAVTVRAGLHVPLATGLPVPDGLFVVHRPDALVVVGSRADPMVAAVIQEFFIGSPRGHCIVLAPGPAESKVYGQPRSGRLRVIDWQKSLTAVWKEFGIDGPSGPASPATDRPGVLFGKSFTDREGQVFTLVGKGLTNVEIAGRLQLSVHTIRAHRKRIAEKLGVDGAEVARRAILMGKR